MLAALTPLRRKRLGQLGVAVVAVVFATLAVRMFRSELRPEVWAQLPAAIDALPLWRVVGAVVVVVGVYTWLGWFDRVGFFVVKQPISTPYALRTGFMGYALAHNLGLAPVTGTAFRARRYHPRGIATTLVARIYGNNVTCMWLGFALALGTALIVHPSGALRIDPLLERGVGVLLVGVSSAYVVAAFVGVPPLRIKRLSVQVPPGRWALVQVLSGALHWTLSATVLWLVLPGDPMLVEVLGALCLAQVVAGMSHIPGGVGVLEGMLLLQLGATLERTGVIAAVLLFRAVYYLLPLGLTVLMLVAGHVVAAVNHLQRRAAPAPVSS